MTCSIYSMLCPSMPGAPLFFFTRNQASHNTSLRYTLSYNAPNFLSSDCFAARESVSCKALTLFRMFLAFQHSRCPHYSLHVVEVRLHAPRKLCCLSLHHFRAAPTPRPPVTSSCQTQPACKRLTTDGVLPKDRSLWRRQGLRCPSRVSFTACHRPYSGFLTGACPLCFPVSIDLPLRRRGSASILSSTGLSRNRTLPVIPVRPHFTKLHRSRYATACGFGKHP